MSTNNALSNQLQLMIQKAARSIAAAKLHFEKGDYDFASSRAYYSVFYVMEAVLLTKGLSFSKHGGVIGAFNRYFVKARVFPKEFSKLISRLFRERQDGDYQFDLSIEEGDAEKDIQIAEKILKAITDYLVQEGFVQLEED
ncbi:MAG: HEPN domain-containing protein [Candidatus Poribacteria bacterium]